MIKIAESASQDRVGRVSVNTAILRLNHLMHILHSIHDVPNNFIDYLTQQAAQMKV